MTKPNKKFLDQWSEQLPMDKLFDLLSQNEDQMSFGESMPSHSGSSGSEEEPCLSPSLNTDLLDKLQMLKDLVERLDHPQVQLSFQELGTIVMELGLFLKEVAHESRYQNPDVFEDPQNRGDSLGNVKMIHRKLPQLESEVFESLGQNILRLYHIASARKQLEKSSMDLMDRTVLGEFDDLSSGYCPAMLRFSLHLLRLKNYRLENQNDKLAKRLRCARNAATEFRALAHQPCWCSSCGRFIVRNQPKSNHFTCADKGQDSHQTRNMVENHPNSDKRHRDQKDSEGNFYSTTLWLDFD